MYTIIATYITGDSFGCEEVTHEIPLIWEDINLAKQAMEELHEHHLAYQNDLDIKDMKDKPWCDPMDDIWEYTVKLELDNGERQNMFVSWNGYFERLIELKVAIVDETKEMRIKV